MKETSPQLPITTAAVSTGIIVHGFRTRGQAVDIGIPYIAADMRTFGIAAARPNMERIGYLFIIEVIANDSYLIYDRSTG